MDILKIESNSHKIRKVYTDVKHFQEYLHLVMNNKFHFAPYMEDQKFNPAWFDRYFCMLTAGENEIDVPHSWLARRLADRECKFGFVALDDNGVIYHNSTAALKQTNKFQYVGNKHNMNSILEPDDYFQQYLTTYYGGTSLFKMYSWTIRK